MTDAVPSPSALSRVPPQLRHALIRRGEWSHCALEHSRIGPIEFDNPPVAFHHLAVPLARAPIRFGLHLDGRRRFGRNAPDTLTMIAAGSSGPASWDGEYEASCCYFTDAALGTALGMVVIEDRHRVRTAVELHAPRLVRLVHALHRDAADGQPHGALVGDAIFAALAAELVPAGEHRRIAARGPGDPWRVRRALEYIHAHLTEPLSIDAIAAAAATSPFYLQHQFRQVLGMPVWRYVRRERARHAVELMRNGRLALTTVASAAGFDTYAGFIDAVRDAFGTTPARLRRQWAG